MTRRPIWDRPGEPAKRILMAWGFFIAGPDWWWWCWCLHREQTRCFLRRVRTPPPAFLEDYS